MGALRLLSFTVLSMFRRKGPVKYERPGKLTDEQRELVLNCLACRMAGQRIIEYLQAEFGVTVKHPAICYYKRVYAAEIAARRERYLAESKVINLPFVAQADRLAEYSRHVSIELRRGRLREAREALRSIAEETGELRQTRDVNINASQRTTAELLEIVRGALGGTDADTAGGGGGAGEEIPGPAG